VIYIHTLDLFSAIYIHTLEVEEAKRKAVEAERKESEDRMLDTLEGRFSLILEEKLKEK
jgi:hypothetical protein